MKKIFFLVFISISINILGQDNCKFCDSLLQLQKQKWSKEISTLQNAHCYIRDTTFLDTTYVVKSQAICSDGRVSYTMCSKSTEKSIIEFNIIEGDTIYMYGRDVNMPSFPGGEQEMMKFISKNIVYPQKEKESGISGTCYVTFIVEKDGSLSNIKILRGVTNGSGCDEEVLRIIHNMPKWKPGSLYGQVVKVQFNLPVKFTLIDYGRHRKR